MLSAPFFFHLTKKKTVILSGAQRSRRTCVSSYLSENKITQQEEIRANLLTMHEKSYFVYIVASRSHTLYIGVTGHLHKRIFEHKQKLYSGFSATYNCNRLIWFEQYEDVRYAIDREKQLKGWRRAKKIALIEKLNPTWSDLSEGWYAPELLAQLQQNHEHN